MRDKRGNLSEYPVALMVLLLIIVVPLIDLLGVVTGSCVACLIAHQASSRAADHQLYTTALSTMQTEATNLLSTGFAAFARMRPVGGYQGSGADLYILESNYRSGGTKSYGPNLPVETTIDPSTCLYECNVQAQYQVGPTVSLASMPFIGDVPGLGKPALIRFAASRAAEYPMGLNKTSDVATTIGAKTVGPCNIPWDAAFNPAGSSWNFPNIYQMIKARGFGIIDDDVIVVPANKFQWTATVLQLNPGVKLSWDIRSDGSWTLDGVPVSAAGEKQLGSNGTPLGGLIAKIGNGRPFLLGPGGLCDPIRGKPGILYVAMNAGNGPAAANAQKPVDPQTGVDYAGNKGAQIVRIIVAQ